MIVKTALAAAVAIVGMVSLAVSAGAARDPLSGQWVAVDTAGDQSTDRYVIGSPSAGGVRPFTVSESYGTFCETDGAGTGGPLTATGTATLSGSVVTLRVDSWSCGTRKGHGAFESPVILWIGMLDGNVLDLGPGYYKAIRVGS